MAYFSQDQIARAKEIDLLTYLQNNEPDELIHESRESYHTKTHDSLKISNGKWYWFSRSIGGYNALEYLIQVKNFKFTDAVSHLINQNGIEKNKVFNQKLSEKEKIERFKLPDKAPDNFKVISYLKSRGISSKIIDECINKGFIYQEYQNNNAVFVGFDENNIPRYANKRGTNSSNFKGEAYGSDKNYSFKLEAIYPNNSVHIFESAIDLLSYATLMELNNQLWDLENLVSLAGVYKPSEDIFKSKKPKALEKYLSKNKNIDTIYVHFDNDEAGKLASQAIQICFSDSYKIINLPPKSGKDFNDYLCEILKINHKNKYDFYR